MQKLKLLHKTLLFVVLLNGSLLYEMSIAKPNKFSMQLLQLTAGFERNTSYSTKTCQLEKVFL